jgi:hypothetical protein
VSSLSIWTFLGKQSTRERTGSPSSGLRTSYLSSTALEIKLLFTTCCTSRVVSFIFQQCRQPWDQKTLGCCEYVGSPLAGPLGSLWKHSHRNKGSQPTTGPKSELWSEALTGPQRVESGWKEGDLAPANCPWTVRCLVPHPALCHAQTSQEL